MNHDRGNLDSRAPYKAMDWIARVEIEWTESPRRTRRTQAWNRVTIATPRRTRPGPASRSRKLLVPRQATLPSSGTLWDAGLGGQCIGGRRPSRNRHRDARVREEHVLEDPVNEDRSTADPSRPSILEARMGEAVG
jgi:hypothetical protein